MKGRGCVSLLCLVALAVSGLSCGGGARTGRTTIVYWDINPGANRTPYTKYILAEFEKRNPEYTVKYVAPPYSVSRQKFIAAIAAGRPPDCSEMFLPWVSQFAAMGALENLEPYIANWPGSEEMDESAWKQVRAFGSPAYMIPCSIGTDALFYRMDWFKEAGMGPPETWDEFLEAAKKMTKPEVGQYGFGMRGGLGGTAYAFYFMMAGTEGKFFDADGNCLLDKPEAVRGLEFYADLFRVHKVTPPTAVNDAYREMISAFYSGNTAMYIHNNGSIGDQMRHLGEGKFMTAQLPHPSGGRMYPGVSTNGYAIYSKSKVKDACWKLVTLFASREMNSYWNQNTGGMPANKLSQEEDWFKSNPYNAAFLATIRSPGARGETLMHLPEAVELEETLFTPELQKCLLGIQTPQETARKIAGALTEAQKKWLAKRQGQNPGQGGQEGAR